MRLATYNVEWFDALFDNAGRVLADDAWSARYKVTRAQQAEALGKVFTAIDADAVMVIEAPDTNSRRDTSRALRAFAAAFDLRTTEVLTGFANETQQEIALMYDPARLSARHAPLQSAVAPRFDGVFRIDLDIDATEDRVTFSKPPLEVRIDTTTGRTVRLIGAHLKSKAPHGARGHDQIMRMAIANRRKQLAQAIWLRRRVDALLEAGEDVVVLGDLNDGPGLDEYENLFGRSSVEIVLGEGARALSDPHAARALLPGLAPQPSTARFFLKDVGRYMQFMLDYAMVSAGVAGGASWRIWHPFDDPGCWHCPDLREALLLASDHFPVTVDLDL
ncbi:endonuclease [Salipiger aestuarii]|uniref:Endonuclease/exonuclease/phosphatase family protein n=1 Tax=Salipiger aestuarii TaxID=568098 RepID=A0A327Y0T2_9RHOB|nr:endonuclease/exonuclease/phosphatase family protein [Salipiger aestuarii]KAA8606677.1 endonuclease [Salipiger aestuarii]KAA8610540.1 endonuclease [Salipiger aestuarii]KAB2541289.1 endonuclease [Salipiger aestuarii]RAK13942.1 endonuclease/exonuclease/phosphatase family protein [Salipiger aestuarii]